MSEKQPSPSEQAAHDAICALEEVQRSEFEPNGPNTTPDWRMWMADGRVADVEVTRAAEKGTRELLAAGHDQKWCVGELALEWTVRLHGLAQLHVQLRGILADLHDEWQASDRRYLSEDFMSLLYPQRDSLATAEFTAGN